MRNKNSKKILIILCLVFLWGLLIYSTLIKNVDHVNAQNQVQDDVLSKYGTICQPNYVDCVHQVGPKWRNLMQDLKNGDFKVVFPYYSINNLISAYDKHITNTSNIVSLLNTTSKQAYSGSICYNTEEIPQKATIIPVLLESSYSDVLAAEKDYIKIGKDFTQYFDMASIQDIGISATAVGRACGIGLSPQQAPNTHWPTWACCPANTQLIANSDLDRLGFAPANEQLNSACCPLTNGTPVRFDGTNCFDSNNKEIGPPTYSVKPANINGFNGHYAVSANGNPESIKMLGIPLGFNHTLTNLPIYGEASTSGIKSLPFIQTSDSVCPSTSACALYGSPDDNHISFYSYIHGKSYVGKPSDLTVPPPNGNSLSCIKCYNIGEPIFLDTLQTVDHPQGELVSCSSTRVTNQTTGLLTKKASGFMRSSSLINNSADQTFACSLSDESNNAACNSCLSSGGLWLANGCVDPTPNGIITGLIRIVLGVIGGVALIQLIIIGIMYQSGNEARIAEARKNLVAIISGLLLLIFSVLILRVIGVNLLDILPTGSV